MGQTGVIKSPILCFCLLSLLFLLLQLQNILRGIGKPYVKSLDSCQIYLRIPPYGSNWGDKIADFVFWPFISFILAFRALECIKRYWETICEESR